MSDLTARTLSQGLQALVPVAIWIAWAARHHGRLERLWTRVALAVSLPVTVVASQWFRVSMHQSQWEAALAASALIPALWFLAHVTGARRWPPLPMLLAGAIVLLIVRQSMEIGATVLAIRDAGSAVALRSLVIGSVMAILAAAACSSGMKRLSERTFHVAMIAFAALFIAQLALYTIHESAESGWLPSSEALHTATEPYGPDGRFGRFVSIFLVVLPFGAAFVTAVSRRIDSAGPVSSAARLFHPRAALLLILVSMPVLAEVGVRSVSSHAEGATASAALGTALKTPHVLFRQTATDAAYGTIGVAPLERPDGPRLGAGLACERVAFAADRGICLQANRGVFTTYKALLLDHDLRTRGTIPLDGTLSRARISPDGRVGAVTVFVAGDGYTNVALSTRTILIDMAAGEVLADLEQLTTWRNGARFKSPDFNFWGVTFTRDSNVFYASLQTGGKVYLVRGDLGLRKLTVLKENVECPSISPDDRMIAFKKRVEGAPVRWRFALLDIATGHDWLLGSETRSVDDQIEWLDAKHVLYAVPRPESAVSDVWAAPIDGSGPAHVYIPSAESPAIVH
jgi:hypothetical protein